METKITSVKEVAIFLLLLRVRSYLRRSLLPIPDGEQRTTNGLLTIFAGPLCAALLIGYDRTTRAEKWN